MDLGYKPSRVCCALPAFFDSCSMSAVEKEVAPVKMVTADTDSASLGPGSKPEKPAIDKPREVRPALRRADAAIFVTLGRNALGIFVTVLTCVFCRVPK